MATIHADDDYVAALAADLAARAARHVTMTPEEIEAEELREEEEQFQRDAEWAWEDERRELAKRNRERRPIKNLRLRIKKLAEPRLAPDSRDRNLIGWFAARRLANKLSVVVSEDSAEIRKLLAEGKGGVLATLEKGVSVLVFPLHDKSAAEVWDVLAEGIRETEARCDVRVSQEDFAAWWKNGMDRYVKWREKVRAKDEENRKWLMEFLTRRGH